MCCTMLGITRRRRVWPREEPPRKTSAPQYSRRLVMTRPAVLVLRVPRALGQVRRDQATPTQAEQEGILVGGLDHGVAG